MTVSAAGSDFGDFYAAARALTLAPHSANIYDHQVNVRALGQDSACHAAPDAPAFLGHYYPYPYAFPPLLAVLLQPLTRFPCGTAFQIWLLASLMLWIGIAVLTAAILRRAWAESGPRAVAIPLAVAIVMLSPTLVQGITLGQIFLPMLALLLGAFWLLPDHPRLAGAVMALAAIIQVLPAMLLVYALLAGHWEVVRGAFIAGIVSLAIMAWYAPVALMAAPQGILAGASWALRFPWNDAIRRIPTVGTILVVVVLVCWIGTTLLARRSGYRPTPEQGCSWALVTALLVTPLLQTAYLIWLLPVVVASATPQRQPDGSLRLPWLSGLVVIGAYLALTVLPVPAVFVPWIPLTILGIWAVVGASAMRLTREQTLFALRHSGVIAGRSAASAEDDQMAANVAVAPAALGDSTAEGAGGR